MSISFRVLRHSVVLTNTRSLHNNVRVRFAPSPTGNVHLGGLRTALYNYLFAKANAGKFILRIEDTDQSRVIQGASQKIEQDLMWAGLQPDESPLQGGSFGPYVQSYRVHLYREHANQLLKLGKAYPCFCSEKRLELLRREAKRMQAVPKYDNHCRSLNQSEAQAKMEKGDSFCLRFKLDSEPETFDDLVFGKLTLHTASVEGDPVILKTDGFPTYHLACVVDDHLMKISHVLRGVEWQISTSKHLQMHKALGWIPPKFGHLPLLLNAKGAKLSKRQGDIDVDHFRKSGIFPDVLLSFVSEFGGGFKRDAGAGAKQTVYSLKDLINQFDFPSLNTSSCRVDLDRLNRLNRMKVEEKLKNPESLHELTQQLREIVVEHYKDELTSYSHQLSDARLAKVLQWGLPRMSRLEDFLGSELKFLWVRPSPTSLYLLESELLKKHSDLLEWASHLIEKHMSSNENSRFEHAEHNNFISHLREECITMNIEFKTLTQLMRSALSGLKAGPPIMELINILGPDEAIKRLQGTAKALQTISVPQKPGKEQC